MEAIQRHSWPGNVRELQNVLRRYFTLRQFTLETACEEIADAEPPETVNFSRVGAEGHKTAVDRYERDLIEASLIKHHWHREKAAIDLGMARRTFFRKMKKFGLSQQK
jgi:DNA-binding NtrC family response regulator